MQKTVVLFIPLSSTESETPSSLSLGFLLILLLFIVPYSLQVIVLLFRACEASEHVTLFREEGEKKPVSFF